MAQERQVWMKFSTWKKMNYFYYYTNALKEYTCSSQNELFPPGLSLVCNLLEK